jgi:hypothetical protein
MTKTHFLGGYYLVESSPRKSWMNNSLIPQKFYSLSNCICDHHPDLSILTWVVGDSEDRDKEQYRRKLKLTIAEFQLLQSQADRWFDQNRYGWQEVFLDLDLAREFATDYLSNIQNIKLLAIATTAKYRDLYLQEEFSSNNAEEGVYKALKSNQAININHNFLGYEVLCNQCGIFHSFVCNGLETDFAHKLNIKLNQHGLIDQYDQAIQASDYANHPDTGAEPLLWIPWAIIELTIQS